MSSAPTMATELSKLQHGPSSIKTPQELVHIKHDITLLQYKYWVLMLRTYRELYLEGQRFGDDDFCYLSMDGVEAALGYRPKVSEVKADLLAIRRQDIIFNVLEKDGKKAQSGAGFISAWFVSSARIGVKFPTELRRAVENVDRKDSIFQLLNWHVFNSFSGKYEAILYKLCKDYVGVGKTKPLSVEQYRDYMGIKPEEYTDFKRLNQWCISGPIKKINASEVSDIEIEFVPKKDGRRIVGVQFNVRLKKQTVMDFGDDPAFRFAKISISPVQQRKYLAERTPEAIEMSIRRANEYAEESERKGKPVDLGKVYATAIVDNWGEEYAEKLSAAAKKAEKERAKASAAAEKGRREALRKEFDDEWREKADAVLAKMAKKRLQEWFEEWKASAPGAAIMAKKGTDSVPFRSWARPRALEKPTDADFEAWLESRPEA